MIDESSASFEPSVPAPVAPPRKHRGRLVVITLVAVVLAAGIGVGAWWAFDQHSKLGDTQAELTTAESQLTDLQTQSAQQISELETQSAGLRSQLTDTADQLAALETEHGLLAQDHEQLLTESDALEASNADLRAAIEDIDTAITATRELTTAMAVLSTPVNGYMNDQLPEEIIDLLDELAIAVGWYPTAADYADNGDLVRAHIVSILEDAADPALADEYQAYLNTSDAQQEFEAFTRWITRLFLDELTGLDQAIQTGEAALAD